MTMRNSTNPSQISTLPVLPTPLSIISPVSEAGTTSLRLVEANRKRKLILDKIDADYDEVVRERDEEIALNAASIMRGENPAGVSGSRQPIKEKIPFLLQPRWIAAWKRRNDREFKRLKLSGTTEELLLAAGMDPGDEESQIEDHREDETNDAIPSTPVVAATPMESDEALLLRSAVPLFPDSDRVDAMGDRWVQQTRESETDMTQMLHAATEQIKAITERSKAMERKVDLMMTQLDWVCGPMGMGTLATLRSAFTNASSSAGVQAATPPYPSSTLYPAGTPFSGNLPSSSSAPPATTSPPPLPPAFKMDRTITSVVDLWREYSEGIGGRPSLHSMYVLDKCHSFGKDGDTERRHFQRRNVIFKHIVLLATNHLVERAVVAAKLEEFRRSKKITLAKLSSMIKAGECVVQF